MAFMIIVVIALLGFDIIAIAQVIAADKEIEILKREQKMLEIRIETLIQLIIEDTSKKRKEQRCQKKSSSF